MTGERKRTAVICNNCKEQFTLQNAELRRRLKKRKNGNGHLFCSVKCFYEWKKINSHKE